VHYLVDRRQHEERLEDGVLAAYPEHNTHQKGEHFVHGHTD
jgi:hypothetical protein